jgi:hypothetical protein
MSLQNKTDNDWYQLLTEENLTKPLWVLFGEENSEKTQITKNLLTDLSNEFSEILFVFIEKSENLGASNLCGIIRNNTHVLFAKGVELKRFWENAYISQNIAQNLIDKFDQINQFIENGMIVIDWQGTNLPNDTGTFVIENI